MLLFGANFLRYLLRFKGRFGLVGRQHCLASKGSCSRLSSKGIQE